MTMDTTDTSGGAPPAGRAAPLAAAARALVVVSAVVAMVPFARATPSADASVPAVSDATLAGGVRGDVVVRASGAPVPGAVVRVEGEPATVRTAADGTFAFPVGIPTSSPYRRLTVDVTAAGWGAWRITGVPLYPSDALILHAQLERSPFVDRVLNPAERTAHRIGGDRTRQDAGITANTCTGWDRQLVPTPTIWVYRTKTGASEQYDFAFYAAHVLPNEWISSWDADALGAGAIAVKTYAGYRAQTGHAYSSGDNCADVRDTIDGYFDPSWTTAAATLAVDATWGSVVFKNGSLFVAHYFAGGKSDPCVHVDGQYAGWMSQWGTQNCALGHALWTAIVDTFYSSDQTPTSWRYTNDLMVDPTFASDGMYAFKTFKATITRTQGTGSDDGWFLHVAPYQGKVGTVYQQRPFLGTSSTRYHDRVSFRCAKTRATPCPLTIRVMAFPDGSNSGLTRQKSVNVPNDGLWHRYYLDPSAYGIVHASVRMSVYSAAPFDTDNWVLRTEFGGP